MKSYACDKVAQKYRRKCESVKKQCVRSDPCVLTANVETKKLTKS